jgi:hypothetical protein
LHFFDSPLPSRPTFAVDLGDFHPDHPNERVWLPTALKNDQGIETFVPTISSRPGFGSIAALAGSIMNTMQNWNDQMQIVMPGFRDRIIHISHRANEGGLNLNMDPQIIRVLANSGHDAADVFIQAFLQHSPPGAPNAWDNHRQVRMRTLLSSIDQQGRNLHAAVARADNPTWRDVVKNPSPPSYRFATQRHCDLALHALDALDALGQYLEDSEIDLQSGSPRPEPEWRGTPRI